MHAVHGGFAAAGGRHGEGLILKRIAVSEGAYWKNTKLVVKILSVRLPRTLNTLRNAVINVPTDSDEKKSDNS